jgi:hypothetical protein
LFWDKLFFGGCHEKIADKNPRGFGLRQSSGALASQASRRKSGRGLPQSKTLSREVDTNSFSK